MAKIPRILIVEDDEIIANLISLMLEKKGYTVVGKTGSGEEAIRKAAELEPDLIFMDINLSGQMDGITAAWYIFQLFHFPIIFLTALCDDSLLERAKNAQPYGYLLKPFTDRELTSNVELGLYNHEIKKKHLGDYPIGLPKKIMELLEVVIVTDTKGRIIFYNPYTLRFLELSDSQLLMTHWREAMMFINDQTDEQLEDPIPEVVRQQLVIMHDFNVAVVTRSGKRRKVSIIARPVKDDKHNLLGVFLHIREKTLDQIKMAAKKA
ncbi:MAG: response regulator [Methanoregula sp.]|nr:response regulator [Methanoregula sp.]